MYIKTFTIGVYTFRMTYHRQIVMSYLTTVLVHAVKQDFSRFCSFTTYKHTAEDLKVAMDEHMAACEDFVHKITASEEMAIFLKDNDFIYT